MTDVATRSVHHLPRNVLSLCSGIGMLDHGLRLAVPDSRAVCMVEGEAFGGACLVEQMRQGTLADCPVWSDATTFAGVPWREIVDTIIAGFPCQPFSTAGKRQGDADSRWLWDDIQRIIGEVQPAWVFLENVPGLRTAPGKVGGADSGDPVRGGAMGAVLGGLADLGYRWTYDMFRASDVGTTHRRERWFLLAHSVRDGDDVGDTNVVSLHGDARDVPGQAGEAQSARRHGLSVGSSDAVVGDTRRRRVQRRGYSRDVPGQAGGAQSARRQRLLPFVGGSDAVVGDADGGYVADSAGVRLERLRSKRGSKSESLSQGRVPQPSGVVSDVGQPIGGVGDGFPVWPPGPEDDAGWRLVLARYPWLAPALPSEPAICVLADGHTVGGSDPLRIDRLRALGNSVVPQCAALAFVELYRRLMR